MNLNFRLLFMICFGFACCRSEAAKPIVDSIEFTKPKPQKIVVDVQQNMQHATEVYLIYQDASIDTLIRGSDTTFNVFDHSQGFTWFTMELEPLQGKPNTCLVYTPEKRIICAKALGLDSNWEFDDFTPDSASIKVHNQIQNISKQFALTKILKLAK